MLNRPVAEIAHVTESVVPKAIATGVVLLVETVNVAMAHHLAVTVNVAMVLPHVGTEKADAAVKVDDLAKAVAAEKVDEVAKDEVLGLLR